MPTATHDHRCQALEPLQASSPISGLKQLEHYREGD